MGDSEAVGHATHELHHMHHRLGKPIIRIWRVKCCIVLGHASLKRNWVAAIVVMHQKLKTPREVNAIDYSDASVAPWC